MILGIDGAFRYEIFFGIIEDSFNVFRDSLRVSEDSCGIFMRCWKMLQDSLGFSESLEDSLMIFLGFLRIL